MASAPPPLDPVTADDVLTVQFTHIRKGGYAQQEVDAFLDRIAATMDSDPSLAIDAAMTADDVRMVQFSQMRRGGYDTREVDMFLDRVVAVLGPAAPVAGVPHDPGGLSLAPSEPLPEPTPEPAPEPPPVESDPVPVPVPAAAAAAAPAPIAQATAPDPSPAPTTSGGVPHLHDPEGAARNLLAAAQLAADTLTSDADAYAVRVRSEADDYASLTRGEADEHAARVTTTAETQAAAIREVAADEARRVAEETRAELVDEISALETKRDELSTETAAMESHVDAERTRLLGIVDDLRTAVLAGGGLLAAQTVAQSQDSGPSAGASDTPAADDDSIGSASSDASVGADVGGGEEQSADDEEADLAAEPARSVFDEPDPNAGDTSAEWLDDDPPAAATIFDVESEDDGGPPTASMQAIDGAGDRFFDELREAEADSLGPLDDDTDAALSAFFEGDEEGDSSGGRWRDRFGPGGSA